MNLRGININTLKRIIFYGVLMAYLNIFPNISKLTTSFFSYLIALVTILKIVVSDIQTNVLLSKRQPLSTPMKPPGSATSSTFFWRKAGQ